MPINNADFGLTLQSMICNHYHLDINHRAAEQFKSNFNSAFVEELKPVCSKVFELVGSKPCQLLTYTNELTNRIQTTSPHNFLLENGKTLSIRTMKSRDKVAPRTVGQAGYQVINELFSEIYGKEIEDQGALRDLVYNHIHEILPIFIDHLFLSDYTVFVSRANLDNIRVISAEELGNYSFSRDEFSFTRNLDKWVESTTLKYHNVSIAEVQTHSNRTFKFRFIVSAIPDWFQTVKETNETLGMTAEAAICDLFNLQKPPSFINRVPIKLERLLSPVVEDAFKGLPKAIKHTGSMHGPRKGKSKCSYDFLLEGGLELSVKTNKGKMVCPPEVGQPSADTCLLYFKSFFPATLSVVTNQDFKQMVFDHIEEIIPIYVKYLFESDWLLWVYLDNGRYKYKTINKQDINAFCWNRELFSFTKKTVAEWNESNTVKYNGISIGEFQVHNHRSCFKFRFNMPIILSLLRK